MMQDFSRNLAALAIAALVFPATTLNAQTRAHESVGITRPSEERKLSFSSPGVVQEAPVKEGDTVKSGQVLLAEDSDIEAKELERLQLLAASNARIEAAQADLGAKTADYERVKKIFDAGGGNESEVIVAQNEMVLRQKQLVVAKEDQQEAKIKSDQQVKKVEKLHLLSPIDGIVERIVTNVGEWADPQNKDGAIQVVKNDPLYLECRDLTSAQVSLLKMGQKLQVRYKDDADKPENWQEAEVFFATPVSDAQADTRLVKLRLANPAARPAGLWMVIQLPDDVAAVAAANGPDGANLANK